MNPSLLLTPDANGEITLGAIDACPLGGVLRARTAKFPIAVFHLADGFVAIKDQCPHADLALSRGLVCEDVVTCPGHNWQFRLRDGACVRGNLEQSLRTFPVTVREGNIVVTVR